MDQAEARAALVAEARSWLRTPWHHRAHVKGAGVDCAQFPLAVYAAVGLVEWFDTGDYPRDWHIHRDEERYLPIVQCFTREVDEAEARPGDVFLCRVGRVFSHGGLIIDWPQGIHACVRAGMVTLCDLDRDVGLIQGARRYFTFRDW